MPERVRITGKGTNEGIDAQVNKDGNALHTINMGQLVPEVYDYVGLTYTGDDLTGVTYRLGGAAGTIQAILVLGYTGDKLTSVTRA